MPEDSQDHQPDQIRAAAEVARRCVILHGVLAAGHNESRDAIVAWLRREGLWDEVSPKESDFLLSDSSTNQQRVRATWRAEALFPLLWSLGHIPDLPSPEQICDVPLMQSVMPPLLGSVSTFISSAKLRSESEIQDANEKIYQIHWRVRDAWLQNVPQREGQLPRMPTAPREPAPEVYNTGVVEERHYALNWLIGYCGQDWDDITTDT